MVPRSAIRAAMNPTGKEEPEGHKEPAPPAVGLAGAHHQEKQRGHEEDDHGGADVRVAAALGE
jgi:hypothetical protein